MTPQPLVLAGLALALLASGCALPARLASKAPPSPPVQGPGYSSETLRYRCEGGSEIDVAYLELGHGVSFAALHHGGRTALLKAAPPTAQGERYIALDEQHSLRWNTQGDSASLSFLAADHTAQERTLLSKCQAVK